jgi:hypothetical protein
MKNLALIAMFAFAVTAAGCFNKTDMATEVATGDVAPTVEVVAPAVMPEVTVEAATGTEMTGMDMSGTTMPTTGN